MDKYALMSVTDKRNIVELAEGIVDEYKIIASGGTAQTLRDGGINVIDVSDYTGYPEMLDGRVKTLHPKIHAGILAKDTEEHLEQLSDQDIAPISLVVCNLYQFTEAIKEDPREENAVENIDIGGPTLIRAAAKNFYRVTVLVDPEDYKYYLKKYPELSMDDRLKFATKAFSLVTHYDISISHWSQKISNMSDSMMESGITEDFFIGGKLEEKLRYGENPHQDAGYFVTAGETPFYNHIRGKKPSYNNILDLGAGIDAVEEFDQPACVIIKHRTPCGAATGETLKQAYLDALETDKMSAYGGVYCFNHEIDEDTANELVNMFVDVMIAPGYKPEALEILAEKEKMGILERNRGRKFYHSVNTVPGGMVVQEKDVNVLSSGQYKFVSEKTPDEATMNELKFAWKVVKNSRSNAIAICTGTRALGIGSGNTSRVGAVNQAIERAADEVDGAVLASDAFFPFPDSIEAAAEVGIRAIISPSGSIRDEEVIEAANELGIILVFTSVRAFKH